MISVIIPIYNAEKYISKCISSLTNQTYKELQIILINDGSTDKSLEICNEFQKKDARIEIINQKNNGASSARNNGLHKANGEYIFFLDADDSLPKDALEILIKNIKDADVISGIAEVKSKNGENTLIKCTLNNIKFIGTGIDAIIETKYKNIPPMVWLYMYRRKFLEDNSIYFTEGFCLEDTEFTVKVFYYARKIVFINNIIYYQYLSDNSVMRSTSPKKGISSIEIGNRIDKFIKESVKEKEIKKVYNKYLAYIYSYGIHYFMKTNQNISTLFNRKKDKFIIVRNLIKDKKYIPLAISLLTNTTLIYRWLYVKVADRIRGNN